MGILKLLLLLLFVAFLTGEGLRIPLGFDMVIKPLDITVFTLFVYYVFFSIKNKSIASPFLKPFLVFSFFAFLSLLFNVKNLTTQTFFVSFLYLIRWIMYGSILFLLSKTDKTFKQSIKTMLILCGSAMVLLGFIQYFLYPSLRNLYYLGWDEHMYRMFSTFLDPNYAGTFFVLFFLFLLNLFFTYSFVQQRNKKIGIGLLAVLTLLAVFLTYSRGALIMLLVSTIIFLILLKRERLIVILLCSFLLFFLISYQWFHIENINLLRVASSAARIETMNNSLKIIKDNMLFGVGFNSYRYAQIRYGFRSKSLLMESHADAGVDNSFLFLMATTGIVGMTCYLFFWYKVVRKTYQLIRKKKDYFPIAVFSSIIGLFVNSLFINSLFFPELMIWMWVIIGLMDYK